MMAEPRMHRAKEKPKPAPKPSVRGKRRSKSMSELNGDPGMQENKSQDQCTNKVLIPPSKSHHEHVYGNLDSILSEMNNNSTPGSVTKECASDGDIVSDSGTIPDLPTKTKNKLRNRSDLDDRPKPKPRVSLLRNKTLSTEDMDVPSKAGHLPVSLDLPANISPRNHSPARIDSSAKISPRTDSPARISPRTDSPGRKNLVSTKNSPGNGSSAKSSLRTDSPARNSPKSVSPASKNVIEDKVKDAHEMYNEERSLSTSSQGSRHSLTRSRSYEAAIDPDHQTFSLDENLESTSSPLDKHTNDSSNINDSSESEKAKKLPPEPQVSRQGRGPPPPRPTVDPVGVLAAVTGRHSPRQSPPPAKIKPKRPAPPVIAPKPSKQVIEQVKFNIPSSISTPNISQHAINKSEDDLEKHGKHHQSSSEISTTVSDKKTTEVNQMTQALTKLKSSEQKTQSEQPKSRPSSQFYYALDGSENQAKTERRKSGSVFYCDVEVSKGGTLKFQGIKDAGESKPAKKGKKKGKKKSVSKVENKPIVEVGRTEDDIDHTYEQIKDFELRSGDNKESQNSDRTDTKVEHLQTSDKSVCDERLSPIPPDLRSTSPARAGSDKEVLSDGSSSPRAPPRTKRDKRRSQALLSGIQLSTANNNNMENNDSENDDKKISSDNEKQVLCDTQLSDNENMDKTSTETKEDLCGSDLNTSHVSTDSCTENPTTPEDSTDTSNCESIYVNYMETKREDSSQREDPPSIIVKSASDNKLPQKQTSFPSQAELDLIYLPMSSSVSEGFQGYMSKRHSDVSMCSSTMSDDYTPMSGDSVYLNLMMASHGSGGRPSSWAGPENQDTLTGINLPSPLDESRSSDDSADSESEEDEHDEGMKRMIVESLQQIKSKLERKKQKVFCAAEEMMTSEANFHKVLKMINEDFRAHVRNAKGPLGGPVLPDRELDSILKYLPLLQNFSEDLLSDLKQRVENWDQHQKIADVFVKKGPFLKMYTNYIREFEPMCSALEEARKKFTEFDKAANEFEAGPHCCHLAIKHFMLKPIQRIPQYRLLLLEYQKHIVEGSPDYDDTKVALKIVSEVADHANDSMAFGDNIKKLMEIQNSLIGQFEVIKPGRLLLKSGELMKMSRKEMQKRMFFLFNDILLCTTPISTGYKYNSELPLAGMKVCKPDKEDFQNDFSIISTTRSFNLSASTPEERDEWISTLKETVTEYNQKRYTYLLKTTSVDNSHKNVPQPICPPLESDFRLGHQAPAWVPDSRVSMCVRCHEEFTMTFRRHHCRACGKVFCGPCCDNRAPLRYQGYKQGRVCIDCFELLKKEFEKWMESLRRSGKSKEERMSVMQLMRGFVRGTVRGQGSMFGSFGKGRRKRPSVLHEVKAMESDVDISGYLAIWENKRWKKTWFVLKQKVLYFYKASEDTAAVKSIPIVGMEVHIFKESFQKADADMVFHLSHKNVPSMVFKAKEKIIRDRWVKAMKTATQP